MDLVVHQLPPHLNSQIGLEADARLRIERRRKGGLAGMPTSTLIFVLPFALLFWGLRKVYRMTTGYAPPTAPTPDVLNRTALKAVMNDICSGSGAAIADEGSSATCDRCGKTTGVANGKLTTHGW